MQNLKNLPLLLATGRLVNQVRQVIGIVIYLVFIVLNAILPLDR